jgi:deoxyribonuclease-1
MEWEHIVPAENFGRSFAEWRKGHSDCTDRQGQPFEGRRCAEKVNSAYRYMQADMHNLVPAIGAVNALRRNYDFAMLPDAENTFGICAMKIQGKKAEPPESARGLIARTYKYMAGAYPRYRMGGPTEKLMEAWDNMYPPNAWECARSRRIEAVQGNRNEVTEARCREAGL